MATVWHRRAERIRKPVLPRLAAITFAVLVWAHILSWFVVSGAVWSFLGTRLSGREEYQVVAGLFAADVDDVTAVAIGDQQFLDRIAAVLPDDGSIACIRLPRYDARDLDDALAAVLAAKQWPLVLQGGPQLWSDLDFSQAHSGPQQKTTLWTLYADPSFSLFPRDNVGLLFDVVADAARRPTRGQVLEVRRPATLARLSFTAEPYRRLTKRLQGWKAPILWIDDRDGLDEASNPELIAAFEAAIANDGLPAGRYVPWPQLPDTLAEVITR